MLNWCFFCNQCESAAFTGVADRVSFSAGGFEFLVLLVALFSLHFCICVWTVSISGLMAEIVQNVVNEAAAAARAAAEGVWKL